jgi:two-component system LytT family response regulator
MTIRTILVDDEPLATQGLQLRAGGHDDVEVVATAANGREAIRAIKTHKARPRLPRHPDARASTASR